LAGWITLRLDPRVAGAGRRCGHLQGTARTLFDYAGDLGITSQPRNKERRVRYTGLTIPTGIFSLVRGTFEDLTDRRPVREFRSMMMIPVGRSGVSTDVRGHEVCPQGVGPIAPLAGLDDND
jgi:hypothetical protein